MANYIARFDALQVNPTAVQSFNEKWKIAAVFIVLLRERNENSPLIVSMNTLVEEPAL